MNKLITRPFVLCSLILLFITSSAHAFEGRECVVKPGDDINLECEAKGCTASPIYVNGEYKGCATCVDGYGSVADIRGLTKLGCDTFCAALERIEREPDLWLFWEEPLLEGPPLREDGWREMPGDEELSDEYLDLLEETPVPPTPDQWHQWDHDSWYQDSLNEPTWELFD